MPEPVRLVLDLVEARPFTSMAVLIAAVLYLRLMTSGPRVH